MVRYVVTGALPEEVLPSLPEGDRWIAGGGDPIPPPELASLVKEADGLLCMLVDRIDRELLTVAPRLQVVSQLAVGVDNIDVAACTARGIPVGHTPGVLTETTADTALALLLAVIRRVTEGHELVQGGQWRKWSADLLVGEDLHGSVVGIIGLGRIGTAVARRLQGFGVRLLYAGPTRKPELEAQLRIGYRSIEELLGQSDHVVVCAALTPDSRQVIDRAALALMKPGASIVNIARGGLIDHDALADALRHGSLGRAALDVTDPEPIPAGHPLLSLANCLIIPHLGSASTRTRIAMARLAVENLAAGLRGERLVACVNPEVYEVESASPSV
jgi:lactate dehydrogenase-like 2-hydroxyacid dehydrogenase